MPRTWTWTPPAGAPLVQCDQGAGDPVLKAGTRGLTAPPYRVSTEARAGVDGVDLTAVDADARDVALGLMVTGATVDQLRARVAALVAAVRPRRGDGVLTITDELGHSRSLALRYIGGLEGDGAERVDVTWRGVIRFRAFDPWWYGPEVELPALLGPPPMFFPLFPIRFPPSALDVRRDVHNDGDEDAYPRWRIIGPGSGLLLTRHATPGDHVCDAACLRIGLSGAIADGQAVVIDTRPGHQSVTDAGTGANLFGRLTTDPAMWALEPGANDVAVAMADVAQSSRVIAYLRPRYAGDR